MLSNDQLLNIQIITLQKKLLLQKMFGKLFQLLQSCQNCIQKNQRTDTIIISENFNYKSARNLQSLKTSKSDHNLNLRFNGYQKAYKMDQQNRLMIHQIYPLSERNKMINSKMRRISLNQQSQEQISSMTGRNAKRLHQLQKSAEQRDFFLAKLQWKISALKKDLGKNY